MFYINVNPAVIWGTAVQKKGKEKNIFQNKCPQCERLEWRCSQWKVFTDVSLISSIGLKAGVSRNLEKAKENKKKQNF